MTSQDVEYHLEQMMPEIRDLEERQIFTLLELQEIMKKRRNFEFKLKRFKKEIKDFTNYIEFEINLNLLRVQRKKKFKLDTRDTGVTISDYSLVKRIHVLYQKLIKTFPMEISSYLAYIEWASSVESTKVLSRTLAMAIQLHPNIATFWILAAKWEWDHNQSVSAARILLQRGIRLNPNLVELWVEYFKLEVAWILKLQARRSVLFGTASTKVEDGEITSIQVDELDVEKHLAGQDSENELVKASKHDGNHALMTESLSGEQKSVLYEYVIPKTVYKAAKNSMSDVSVDFYFFILEILNLAGPETKGFREIIYADLEQVAVDAINQASTLKTKKFDQTKVKEMEAKAVRALNAVCKKETDGFSLDEKKKESVLLETTSPSFPLALDKVCQCYESQIKDLQAANSSICNAFFVNYIDFLMETFSKVSEENLLQYLLLKADACFSQQHESCASPVVETYLKWLSKIPNSSAYLKAKVVASGGSWVSDTTSESVILEKGLESFPENGRLLLEKCKLDPSFLQQALKIVTVDADGLFLWQHYFNTQGTQQTEDYTETNFQFEKCINLFSKVLDQPQLYHPILSQYLSSLINVQRNLEKAHHVLTVHLHAARRDVLKEVVRDFIKHYSSFYQREFSSIENSSVHLERLEKWWTAIHDIAPLDQDTWIEHIQFELNVDSKSGKFTGSGGNGASQVYWKAKKCLPVSLHQHLESKYQVLLNA